MKSSVSFASIFTLFAYLSRVALADFPLYIPGFDPQPLSATVLGVGSDGGTTYQISPGKATDSSEDDSNNPTFTLVEGPTNAVYTVVLPAESGAPDVLVESCTFSSNTNGQAVCIVSGSGTDLNLSGVQTETEEIAPITVMGNAAGGTAPTPTSGTGGSPGSTSGSDSSLPSNTASTSSPTNSGAAGSITQSGGIVGIMTGALLSILFAAY